MARKPRVEYPGALYHVIARGNNRQPVDLKSILGLVAKRCNIDERDVLSQNQSRRISLARHLFIYVAKEEFNFSGKEIADLLDKDNSSISHATRKIRANLVTDIDLKLALESILEQIDRG